METKKGIFQTQHSSSFFQYSDIKEAETYLKHPQNAPIDSLDENQQLGLKYSNDKSSQHNRFDNEYRVIRTPDNVNVIPSPHSFNNHYVQYQKSFQSPYYNTTQGTPASNLSHNIVPNTSQVSIPQQPHYHPFQVQKTVYKGVSNVQQHSTKINDLEKKKISGATQLKSPVAKRPLEAPVTMQGWLHKQGSEGLMLWKKRWFVLSDYCLFYYKGPEEEKILGSVLLPSYKVSVCRPEGKIGKKYAFKCEHANMRTYILAADSQELMKQWIYILNLATMMQTNIEQQKSTIYNTPIQQRIVDNCECPGGHYQKTPTSRATHSPSSCILQDQASFNQPLYANAPPKPRRLNDGLSSPSSDISDRYNPHYIDPGSLEKSPVANYSTVNYSSKNSRDYAIFGGEFQVNHDSERRTPDTYGRSKLTHPLPTDYEDVYSEQQTMYRRPLSPVAHSTVVKTNNPLHVNPIHRYYTPVNMVGPTKEAQCAAPQMRKNHNINIVRPHSADFLEYELNHKQQDNLTSLKQRPRPKSSLEINANSTDNHNYFYSKERYAEKMRKSAQYLQKVPPKFRNEVIYNKNESITCPAHENTYPFTGRSHVHTHIANNNKIQVNDMHNSQPVRSKSVLSDDSISKEFSTDMDTRLFIECDSLSSDYMFGNCRSPEYDLITRSASARLAQTPSQVDRSSIDSIRSNNRDRKREESIRRLLEWKQRMLQSPLNRKIQGNVAYRAKNDFYNNHDNYKCLRNSKQNELYMDEDRSKSSTQYNSYSSDDEASGSISINTRDAFQVARETFPRILSTEKGWRTSPNFSSDSRSVEILNRNCDKEQNRIPNPKVYYSNLTPARQENWPFNEKVSVSAGELLGRTHEELVLLLIQLRRQSAQTLQAIQNYYNEIDMIQVQLYAVNQARRMENLQKLERIKQHLLELENQYEKGKPLVNLVDNMVKLGSLYRSPQDKSNVTPHIRDQLEFYQQIQERKLLAEEKREWSRLNTNHYQFQEKVQQLYMLDRLIHEESGALQNLQKDKEDIERALGELRHRLSKGFKDPSEIEVAHKQQIMLENELSRVHYMLAQNSKKLEETVSGNARLEHELMVLKQKLQSSRQQSSPQYSQASDNFKCTMGSNVTAESDLQKVEKKIGELQKQRQKLSLQVRQLTDKSPNMYQKSAFNDVQNDIKKKIHSLWRETDLDTMSIVDHGEYECNSGMKSIHLNMNAESKVEDYDYYNHADSSNTSMSDNLIMPQEKQEIKTVRIVKRESEKRQRDKEKLIPSKWDAALEEYDSSGNYNVIFKSQPKVQDIAPLPSSAEEECDANKSISSSNICDFPEQALSPDISPVYKSEAARQIITEMTNQNLPKQPNRRTVPKEKRRHYTAPHNHLLIKSLNQLPTDTDTFDKINQTSRRARDDLDMEIALRQRIDAPDVVRSTLINTELKYNERTIDDLLGIPDKINIPERYIPEQLPQFSVEEQEYRTKKAESIKKMLSETTLISTNSTNFSGDNREIQKTSNGESITTSKILDEKKQREHLLQLNQILAKQVMEMSKIVADRATAKLSNEVAQLSAEEEDLSPVTQLPLYQQRDNFYS